MAPWWGRWGVNFVYGTWQVLAGLKSRRRRHVRRLFTKRSRVAAKRAKARRQLGRILRQLRRPLLKGQGESTASQTAWGIMGLLAVAGPNDPAVKRGVDWLIAHQARDGAWDEAWFTGTGFPKVFYLKYHLYRHYFPLMVLRGIEGIWIWGEELSVLRYHWQLLDLCPM